MFSESNLLALCEHRISATDLAKFNREQDQINFNMARNSMNSAGVAAMPHVNPPRATPGNGPKAGALPPRQLTSASTSMRQGGQPTQQVKSGGVGAAGAGMLRTSSAPTTSSQNSNVVMSPTKSTLLTNNANSLVNSQMSQQQAAPGMAGRTPVRQVQPPQLNTPPKTIQQHQTAGAGAGIRAKVQQQTSTKTGATLNKAANGTTSAGATTTAATSSSAAGWGWGLF